MNLGNPSGLAYLDGRNRLSRMGAREQSNGVRKIRVLVANQPRLLRELVLEAVAGEPRIEVVGEVERENEILAAVERTRPHVLIIALGASDERPPICDEVLVRFPEVRVVAIAPDRNSTIYYWASPEIYSARLETSETGVLLALRSLASLSERVA